MKMNTTTLITGALVVGAIYYVATNKSMRKKIGLSGVGNRKQPRRKPSLSVLRARRLK